jgi:hypothetical protein
MFLDIVGSFSSRLQIGSPFREAGRSFLIHRIGVDEQRLN